jgi:ferric-dicitrate binding protein FerR (iron transport regulator)
MSFLRGNRQKTISMKRNLSQQEQEHIWQLMCEKMAGIISPKDQQYLEMQLQKDEHMQEAFHTLAFALSQEENLDLERLQHDDEWKEIFREIKPPPKSRTPLLTRLRPERVTAAAALAGLLLSAAGYYYFSGPDIPSKATVADLPAEKAQKKEVQLQLADNRHIPLPEQQTFVSLGDVQLHNTQQSLSFDAKDNFTVHGQHTLIVPAARDYKVTLADGTEIWLNSASRLQFPFSFNGNSREISLLSGEAYVKAAPDPTKPFIIHTAHSTIQVLGTEFNINAYDRNMLRVSLVSGAVKMQAGTAATVIKPGTEAVYTNEKGLRTQPFDPREVLSWREGKHFFANAPMSEVCAILARNMGITAVVDSGSSASTKHFSGVVNKYKPIEEFMVDVKNAVDIDYYFDESGVLHFK